METAQINDNVAAQSVNQQSENPLHQYATTPVYPQQVVQTPVYPVQQSALTEQVMSAGVFGLIVVATGTMGANLHKVQGGDMTLTQSVNNSLVNGVKGGVAAASATAASKTLTAGGVLGLAVTLAAATGVSYLLNKK